jgi:hypothetical protein
MRIWCLLYRVNARQVCREGPGRTISLTLAPSAKREAIRIMTEEHGLPMAQACRAARLSRAAYYKPVINWMERDAAVIAAINVALAERIRWGFWKCYDRIRNLGLELPLFLRTHRTA